MVLVTVATAQSLAYLLTLQGISHAIAELLVAASASHGACLIGGVTLEETVWPIMKYLGLLLLCLVLIALLPGLTTFLPRYAGS